MKTFFKYYLPTIIWALVIFGFSTIPGGESHTETIKQVFTRKGAHFVEFSILAFLIWRIFYSAHKFSWQKSYFFTLFLATFYGASDEWHQTFVFGRTGKIIDAIFDMLSVIFFLEIIIIYIQKRFTGKNFLILFFSVLALAGLEFKMILDTQKSIKPKTQNNTPVHIQVDKPEKDGNEKIVENNVEIKIPDKILISVPFTSQAPFGIWDEIHEETCEEASIVMLKYFFDKKKLTPEIAEKEIQALVKFQNKNYGDFKDTTAKETANLFLQYYGELPDGKKLKIIYDFKKEDLKKQLVRGFPIIVPAAGRKLGNPNFKTPGPLYHNLVLVGYDGDTIITNDPGTRKGGNYQYNIDVLYNAIHDFPGNPEDIEKGQRAMIVVE